MSTYHIVRITAVLTGAAALFGLTQAVGTALYLAIPAGIVVYLIVLVGLGLLLKVEPPRRK